MFRPRTNYLISAISAFIAAILILIGLPIMSFFTENLELLESIFMGFGGALIFTLIGGFNYLIYKDDLDREQSLVKENIRLKEATKKKIKGYKMDVDKFDE